MLRSKGRSEGLLCSAVLSSHLAHWLDWSWESSDPRAPAIRACRGPDAQLTGWKEARWLQGTLERDLNLVPKCGFLFLALAAEGSNTVALP